MPTKQWTQARRLITFWLTEEEAAQFRRACAAEGRTQADVLRQTVQILIGQEAPQ